MPLSETMPQATGKLVPSPSNPWYADATIGRDRNQVLDKREADWDTVCNGSSRFVLQTSSGIFHQLLDKHDSMSSIPSAMFWTYDQLVGILQGDEESLQKSLSSSNAKNLLAWVGELDGFNYWVYYDANLQSEQALSYCSSESSQNLSSENNIKLQVAGLREFGDSLQSSAEAAILATCNGMVEFHKTHPFCSKCGSPTRVTKAGGSRKCTSDDCGAPVYPRIDVASIMLITTQCEQYALLGRKSFWPKGRYSTLAGFAEIGETMEQCCARETFEESGVQVDPSSIRFVCSQPWPFPRSLMVGFRGKALQEGQPSILIEELEMEDIQWFHKDYVRERLDGGSTALTFEPNEQEQEFHIPGPASLARILITQWANELIQKRPSV